MLTHRCGGLALAILLLVSIARSQQTIISPITAATVDGASQNLAPWVQTVPRRYLQIHSDIGGSPKILTKVAFRRNAAATNGSGTRVIDLELFMGTSVDFDQASFLISSNYTGPRTNVVARKSVTFGPLQGTTTPPPFECAIALDSPYPYLGSASLAWEAVVYSNVLNGTFANAMDAEEASVTVGTTGITGPGCVAGAQTSPMIHVLRLFDIAGIFALGGYLANGPPNAPAVLFFGSMNPNQSIPGLCSPLYTNLVIALPIGLTNASGFIGETQNNTTRIAGGAFTIVLPNTFQQAMLYTQVHAFDASSTQPIPIANSDGLRFLVPTTNPSKVVRVTRVYNHDGGPTGNIGQFFDSSVGYGLVTEFSF